PAQLAEEARGHPLYIDELARHQASAAGSAVGVLRLDEALWSRACLLDSAERQTLAAIAVSGGPLAQEVLERATSLTPNAFHRALAVLRVEHLARTTGPEKSDLVECYHDRVREAIAAHLDSTEQRDIHRRLAMALAGSPDDELQAIHWHAAGEADRAARFSIKAAEEAGKALAFDRAARLCQFTLQLLREDDPERYRVLSRLGDMLANAGRGGKAGEAYLAAVPGTSDAETSVELRRRATEQFLISGHVDEGLETLRAVL